MDVCSIIGNAMNTLDDWGILDIPILKCFIYGIYIFWVDLFNCN